MDQETILYGCIKDLPLVGEEDAKHRRRTNRAAILSLPRHDEWPYLSSDMFAASGDEETTGTYKTQLIHFAASYKGVEYEWGAWVKKFEELLKKMYWVSVIVHLDTAFSGKHTFSWESANDGYHKPTSDQLNLKCEWVREGTLS